MKKIRRKIIYNKKNITKILEQEIKVQEIRKII